MWILYKAVSTGAEARHDCMRMNDPAETLRPAAPTAPWTRQSCAPRSWLGASHGFEKESCFRETFPAIQTSRNASTTFQGPGWISIQLPGPRKWLWPSRKGFVATAEHFVLHKSEEFPTWREGCAEENTQVILRRSLMVPLVDSIPSAISKRAVKSWIHHV